MGWTIRKLQTRLVIGPVWEVCASPKASRWPISSLTSVPTALISENSNLESRPHKKSDSIIFHHTEWQRLMGFSCWFTISQIRSFQGVGNGVETSVVAPIQLQPYFARSWWVEPQNLAPGSKQFNWQDILTQFTDFQKLHYWCCPQRYLCQFPV